MTRSSGQSVSTLLRSLRDWLSPTPALLAVVALGVLAEAAYNGALPLVLREFIDGAMAHRDPTRLAWLVAGVGAGALFLAGMGLWRDRALARIVAASSARLRLRLFDHLLRKTDAYFQGQRSGDLLNRFSSDIAGIEHIYATVTAWVVLPAIDALTYSALLFYLDPWLAAVGLLSVPTVLIGPRIFARRAMAASLERKDEEGRSAAVVEDHLRNQALVQAYGLHDRALATYRDQLVRLQQRAVRFGIEASYVERSATSGIAMIYVLVLAVGVWRTWEGHLSIGGLAAFQTAFTSLCWASSYLGQYAPQLLEASGCVVRIREVLAEAPGLTDRPGAKPAPRLAQAVELRGVTFGYDPQRPILQGLDLRIQAGQFVVVVGPSGGGKTTLLRLLQRVYDPDAGSVCVDGHDLRDVRLDSWRGQLGVVFQDPQLLHDTIGANIALGRPDASEAEVHAAAAEAEIHEHILSLPEGYATVPGERGDRLSGGQRQRVALARALVRKPTLLLLDEVTAAIDGPTEAALVQTLVRARRGRTVVAVAHRLAMAVEADRVVVVVDGRVAESGTHMELLARGGTYAALWQQQQGRDEAG